jgi:hypothetical protein
MDGLTTVDCMGGSSLLRAMPTEKGCQFKLPDTPAPEWHCCEVPSDFSLTCFADPANILAEVFAFLCEGGFPAEIGQPYGSRPWTVRADVFLDYVQLALEVQLYLHTEVSASSILILRDTSHCDTMRFNRVVSALCEHLTTRGIAISKTSSSATFQVCFDDGFDDEEFEEESLEEWNERVESLLTLLEDPSAPIRLEAVRMLAQWAETNPDSRAFLADALCSRSMSIIGYLYSMSMTTVSESYPVAAALKCITSCPEAAEVLCPSLLPVLEELTCQDLPKLAVGQIVLVVKALQRVGYETGSKDIANPLPHASNSSGCSARESSTLSASSRSSGDAIYESGSTMLSEDLPVEQVHTPARSEKYDLDNICSMQIPWKAANLCAISEQAWE